MRPPLPMDTFFRAVQRPRRNPLLSSPFSPAFLQGTNAAPLLPELVVLAAASPFPSPWGGVRHRRPYRQRFLLVVLGLFLLLPLLGEKHGGP